MGLCIWKERVIQQPALNLLTSVKDWEYCVCLGLLHVEYMDQMRVVLICKTRIRVSCDYGTWVLMINSVRLHIMNSKSATLLIKSPLPTAAVQGQRERLAHFCLLLSSLALLHKG